MAGTFNWRIDKNGSAASVTLSGRLDESVKLSSLVSELQPFSALRMHLGNVQGLTSVGVREWYRFINTFSKQVEIDLEECSTAFVSQLNLITGFAGHARIRSVCAPFVCKTCGHQERVVVRVSSRVAPSVDLTKCSKCLSLMTFDEVADQYFFFLKSTENGSGI